jgi:hypothetical protein
LQWIEAIRSAENLFEALGISSVSYPVSSGVCAAVDVAELATVLQLQCVNRALNVREQCVDSVSTLGALQDSHSAVRE